MNRGVSEKHGTQLQNGELMRTILVVDDQESIRKLLQRRLRKNGYEIHFAENGELGVKKAFELQPDLILMDMHMPVMDGDAAVHDLRQKGYEGLVVALTASAMVADQRVMIDAGCDDFIPKPIERDFENRIASVLEKAK